MKSDWDERARENAMYYIASGTEDWDEQAFSASGRESTEQLIVPDLDLITGDRSAKELTVLEIGCGVGRMTEHLAALFGAVDGVDVSGEMIERGRERLGRLPNVRLFETNGVDLAPFEGERFDFAFSFIVLQHVPYREVVVSYLRETHRVLKSGGLFKFQVHGVVDEAYL